MRRATVRRRAEREPSLAGHVYVLTSQACEFIKIGGTDYAPLKRIKEINSDDPYKANGPWTLHDFRHVRDWRTVERNLHYTFRSKLVRSIPQQKELFAVPALRASKKLAAIDDWLVLKKPKVDRLFQDEEFSNFLFKFFQHTGILNWLDIQGAWTFSLFPSTSGARYYTLNIGTHEVAFSTICPNRTEQLHMLHMDRLIRDFKEVTEWIRHRRGWQVDDNYASGLDRSTSISFEGDFRTALEFLDLPGVRRAIIAYWTEALIRLKESGSASVHARHHNWNAVAEIRRRMNYGRTSLPVRL